MAKFSSTSEFLIEVIIVQLKHFHLKLFQKKFDIFFVAQTKLKHLLMAELPLGRVQFMCGTGIVSFSSLGMKN